MTEGEDFSESDLNLLLIPPLHPLPSLAIVMLYVIGLGLSDEKDITVKGLEVS